MHAHLCIINQLLDKPKPKPMPWREPKRGLKTENWKLILYITLIRKLCKCISAAGDNFFVILSFSDVLMDGWGEVGELEEVGFNYKPPDPAKVKRGVPCSNS
jgi:hypothetical protein